VNNNTIFYDRNFRFDHDMSILRWLKQEEVAGWQGPDKQQNAEMKSVVAATNDPVRPVLSVVSKKRDTNRNRKQIV